MEDKLCLYDRFVSEDYLRDTIHYRKRYFRKLKEDGMSTIIRLLFFPFFLNYFFYQQMRAELDLLQHQLKGSEESRTLCKFHEAGMHAHIYVIHTCMYAYMHIHTHTHAHLHMHLLPNISCGSAV